MCIRDRVVSEVCARQGNRLAVFQTPDVLPKNFFVPERRPAVGFGFFQKRILRDKKEMSVGRNVCE